MAKKKSRNPIARALKFFIPKAFKNRTKYTRKLKHRNKKLTDLYNL